MKIIQYAKKILSSKYLTFFVTLILFIILYMSGVFAYKGFSKPQVFYNFFIDYAPTIILTAGVTFVLLCGEIDLSGGSVIAFICMFMAKMMQVTNLSIWIILFFALLISAAFGLFQGYLISKFGLQSFIITLAGQFVARGATAMISVHTIDITRENYRALSSMRISMPGGHFSIGALLAIIVVAIGTIILHKTRFGRKFYAIGGDRNSASLMGLNSSNTIIFAYGISGFSAGLAAICYSLIMLSGYTLHGLGMEMEAISSSVIGGTLLAGGSAFLPGTSIGVMIQAVIQTLITFQGTLSAWWTKIVIALLLCLSIVAQSLMAKSRDKKRV